MKGASKDKTNPHFGSKYADIAAGIEAIREPFAENDIAFSQSVTSNADGVTVVTTLLHSSGEERPSGSCWLPVVQKTPQGYGSTITYARRYSLFAAAGIASEDDDGNAGSGNGKAVTPPPAGVEKLKQAATAKPKPQIVDEHAAVEPAATHDRSLAFKFGNGKGTPIGQLSDESVSWYLAAIKRDLTDPEKARFIGLNTLARSTLEAELRHRGLPS